MAVDVGELAPGLLSDEFDPHPLSVMTAKLAAIRGMTARRPDQGICRGSMFCSLPFPAWTIVIRTG